MKSKIVLITVLFVIGIAGAGFAQAGNGMMNGNMYNGSYHQRMMNGDSTYYGMGNMMYHQNMMNGGYYMMNGNYNNMERPMANSWDRMDMQDLMQTRPYLLTIKVLPKMKKQLGLSNDQLNTLIGMQADYQRNIIDLNSKIQKMKLKTEDMMDNNATPDDLEVQLSNSTLLIAKMGINAYETAKSMRGVLNEKQLKEFDQWLGQCESGNCNMYNFSGQ